MKFARRHFGNFIVALFVVAVLAFYLIIGENSYIAVQDNLDLFMAQYAMLRNTGTFFAHNVAAPFLGGVSRDVLPSEFNLYSVLFMIFPPFAAYVMGYVIKVLIAVVGCRLLFMDMSVCFGVNGQKGKGAGDKEDAGNQDGCAGNQDGCAAGDDRGNLATLVGLLYGMLNVFPAFGISFASIPLIIFLLRRVYENGKQVAVNQEHFWSRAFAEVKSTWRWQLLVFCYPFISYFSYFGFFILGYLFVAIIWLWIRDRKFSFALFKSLIVLSVGYMLFEYRLFGMMLFSDTVTIRETMVQTYLPGSEILWFIVDIFVNGMMHNDDAHKFFVMPVCLLYFFYLNISYLVKKNARGIFTDIYNLLALILVFNCVVYGLYFSEPFLKFVAAVLPPLKGFQYNRTIFFNPFIWCAMLFVIGERLLKMDKIPGQARGMKWTRFVPYCLVCIATAIVLLTPTKYNDLLSTAYRTVRSEIYGNVNDELNFREFYSVKLFDNIKTDLGIEQSDYCVAYGMHPAILEYNGIATLDGYLGFYPESYKQEFRKIIAPALERKENTRLYYDEWGARCYLYSGTDDTIVMATRNMAGVTDTDIYIDGRALKDMGCKYLFSRIELSNAGDVGLTLAGSYTDEASPYVVYVYRCI